MHNLRPSSVPTTVQTVAAPKPTRKLSPVDAAQLAGCSTSTIYRLVRAGFVEGERPTPRKLLVDLASLQAHFEAMRDPEFWTPERCSRYSEQRKRGDLDPEK